MLYGGIHPTGFDNAWIGYQQHPFTPKAFGALTDL